MRRTKSFVLGFISASVLTTAVSALANTDIIAKLSSQTFYQNNEKLELEAYNINGYNYVRLRDAAKIFDVNVEYNVADNSVRLGDDLQQTSVSAQMQIMEASKHIAEGKDYAKEDYSQKANPNIFNDTYTRTAYNAIRQSVIDRETILAGNDETGYNGNYQYAHFVDATQTLEKTGKTVAAMSSVLNSMNGYYVYSLGIEPDLVGYMKYPGYNICKPTIHPHFAPANEATDAFVVGIDALTDADKVEKIAAYVADKIFYEASGTYKGINEIFTSDRAVGGTCGSYASAFLYLCQRADIPCIIISDETHAWNEVYADNKWQVVDVGYYDLSGKEVFAKNYPRTDNNIERTSFLKELLVPGATQ